VVYFLQVQAFWLWYWECNAVAGGTHGRKKESKEI
jgi:hypothetical protein